MLNIAHSKFKAGLATRNLLVLLLVATVWVSGCSKNLSEKEYLERAKQQQDKGDLRASIIELKNALRVNPNSVEGRWMLSNIYIEVGDGAAAEKELQRSSELGIPAATARMPLGRAYLLQGQFDRIIKEIHPAAELSDTDNAWVYVIRGLAYVAMENNKEAANEFDAALKKKPEFPLAQLGKAQLAFLAGKIEDAQGIIEKVLAANPDSADAWSLMGDLARSQNKTKEAEEAYGKAIAHRFNNAPDYLKRAFVRIHVKNLEGAASDILALKERVPGLAEVDYLEGNLYYQQQKYAEAQTSFEKVLQKTPRDLRAVYYLGLMHALQGHIELAEQNLSQVLSAHPNSVAVAKLLGEVRLYKGDYAGAESVLMAALQRNPNDTELLNLLGETALPQGKSKQGVEYFRRVIVQHAGSATTHLNLGYGLFMEEKIGEGIQELTKAAEADPQLQTADYLMILGYMKAKKFDEAIKAAESFRQKQPDSPTPLTLLAGAYLGKGDVATAREKLLQALKVAPGDPSAAGNLARLEISNQEFNKARALYDEILKHHPNHLDTLIALAQLDSSQGKVKEAVARLEVAVEEHPNALQPVIMLASYYLSAGQPERVLEVTKGISDDSTPNPFVLGVKGEAQLALNQAANAKVTFNKLVAMAPNSARAHYLLAKAYASLNKADNGQKELDQALKINPDFAPAKIAMARLNMEKNRLEEAAKLIRQLDQAYPSRPEILALQGELAMRQKRPKDAIDIYQKAIKSAPTSQFAVLLGIAYWQAGNQNETVTFFKKWMEEHPNDVDVQYQLANTYLLLNRPDEAKLAFARVVELVPNHVLALNNLAWLMRKEDPQKALQHAEAALKLASDSPLVMDTLGELLLDKGDTERAVRLFTSASEKAPNNFDTRYRLALALSKNGNQDQARQVLKELLKQQKPFPSRKQAQDLAKTLGG